MVNCLYMHVMIYLQFKLSVSMDNGIVLLLCIFESTVVKKFEILKKTIQFRKKISGRQNHAKFPSMKRVHLKLFYRYL